MVVVPLVAPFQGICANLLTVAMSRAGRQQYISSSTTSTGKPSGAFLRLKAQRPSGSPQ